MVHSFCLNIDILEHFVKIIKLIVYIETNGGNHGLFVYPFSVFNLNIVLLAPHLKTVSELQGIL